MTDLEASGANKVDALDSLVDSLAVQNPPAQFFDPNPEQLAVLALDLSPAGFVLGKIGVFVRLVRHVAERRVLITLGPLALPRSTHRIAPFPRLARASDEAASFFANPLEALAPEAGALAHLAFRAAARTEVSLLLEAGILLGG